MATVTLTLSQSAVFQFPVGVIWPNRWEHVMVTQAQTLLLTGSLLIEEWPVLSGRPIKISTGVVGEGYCGLFTVAEVQALLALSSAAAAAGTAMTLAIGTESFSVRFSRVTSQTGLKIEELVQVEAGEAFPEAIYKVEAEFVCV